MVNQYSVDKKLPPALRQKLRVYFSVCYPQRKAFDEDRILQEVTTPLRQEICMHQCENVLQSVHFGDFKFGDLGKDFV